MGLISWNEFSENSHVEPSRNYGRRYLDVLAEAAESPPDVVTFESDSSADEHGTSNGILIVSALGIVTLASSVALIIRSLQRR